MSEHGEWNRKGATLSDVTAEKEYGVTRDFILKGIRAAELPRRPGWRLCAGLHAGLTPRVADVRPEGGARCVSSARRDLCGGRGAILVPTATLPVCAAASVLAFLVVTPMRGSSVAGLCTGCQDGLLRHGRSNPKCRSLDSWAVRSWKQAPVAFEARSSAHRDAGTATTALSRRHTKVG